MTALHHFRCRNIFVTAVSVLLLYTSQQVYAQTDTSEEAKITTNARMIGIGTTNILDTYLSSEKYNGTEIRYISHTQRRRVGKKMYKEIIHQGSFSYADNRSGNGGEMAGMYNFQYGWHREMMKKHWGKGILTIGAGGNIDANAGFIYNTRNSNNPTQARLYINITPVAEVVYEFKINNSPYTLHYELGVPLLGVMFSPNYGQSYYEIFSEGNYDHNIVPTWPGNNPSLRQMLTFDFNLLKSTFRIGYMGDCQQAKANGLKNHIYTHAIVIGMVKRFQLLKL